MLEEETMPSGFRHGAMTLMLLAGATLAAAQENAPSSSATETASPQVSADEESTGSIGTVGIGNREILPLSDEQRNWIFLGVINLPDVPEAAVPVPETRAELPESIELQPLPEIVTRRIPLVGNYKFVKLDDRILLVDPDNREVVAQIPRYKLLNSRGGKADRRLESFLISEDDLRDRGLRRSHAPGVRDEFDLTRHRLALLSR